MRYRNNAARAEELLENYTVGLDVQTYSVHSWILCVPSHLGLFTSLHTPFVQVAFPMQNPPGHDQSTRNSAGFLEYVKYSCLLHMLLPVNGSWLCRCGSSLRVVLSCSSFASE